MTTITDAQLNDAERLCEIAVSAFIEDERHKPDHIPRGGPPGHDEVQNHIDWITHYVYLKYEENGQLCGGCMAKVDGWYGNIFGIFVDASSMNRNIGSSLLKQLLLNYPDVEIWSLETPDYARRNHAFYEKHGFQCIRRSEPESDIGFGFYHYRIIK